MKGFIGVPEFKAGLAELSNKIRGLKVSINPGTVTVEIGNDWLKVANRTRGMGNAPSYELGLVKLARITGSVSSAISAMFDGLKIARRDVVLVIPRHLVTVRMMSLPTTDPDEISDMISLQAVKHTPYSKEEIISSYKIVETSPSGYSKVMLVIAARNIINERMETLGSAGLTVKRVAISSDGIFGWFSSLHAREMNPDPSQGIALIDIDSNYTDFIVVRSAKMVFTRNIFIGSNHLMQDASGWREKFVDELKRSLERYASEEKNIKIARVFLTGSGRNITDLDVLLASSLEMPAEKIDQFEGLNVKPGHIDPRSDEYSAVSITQLVGVPSAGREPMVDLTTGEQKVQGLVEAKRRQLTVMGVLIASIAMLLSLLLVTTIYNKNSYLAKLKGMTAKMEGEADGIEKMRAVIGMVEERLDSHGSSIEVISEIYRITPGEIHLMDINIDENRAITLKGGGFAMSDVFRYVKKLEESDMFENVKATYTTTKRDKGREFAEFEISCTYQK